MGHKKVCLECYRAENLDSDYANHNVGKCPSCSSQMIFVNHKFRPTKKNKKKEWEVVKYLISKGFPFQHIYQEGKSELYKSEFDNYVEYPKTMKEAEEFVEKYKNQRIKTSYN